MSRFPRVDDNLLKDSWPTGVNDSKSKIIKINTQEAWLKQFEPKLPWWKRLLKWLNKPM